MKHLRRFFIIVFSIILVLLTFSSCGGKTKASDKAISVAKSAIGVADDYLDSKLSYSEASEKLSKLKDEMEYVDNLETGDAHKAADFSISTSITLLSSDIFNDSLKGSSDTYDKILKARNDLADKAGLSKR